MNLHTVRMLLAAFIVCAVTFAFRSQAAGPPAQEQAPEQEPEQEPIRTLTVQEIARAEVIGELGLRLGTVVTIEGIAVDGSELRRHPQDWPGHTVLRILKVNGEALEEEVLFNFPGSRKDEAPAFGSEFRYLGYEDGYYEG